MLYDEVDYQNEAKNANEFAAQFADTEWIKVPKVYSQYTKQRTMCMEYALATKINDLEAIKKMGIDPDRMARLSVEAYLQQVLRFGFFHADPHPGNVAVDKGDPEGLWPPRHLRLRHDGAHRSPGEERVPRPLYAVFEKNSDSAVKALSKMGILADTGGDLTAVKRTAWTSSSGRSTSAWRVREGAGREQGRVRGGIQEAAHEGGEEGEAQADPLQHWRGPARGVQGPALPLPLDELTFVVRAFSVLDGIEAGLNKKFDIGEISAPYARNLLIEDNPSSLPPQVVARQRDFQRRFDRQNKAIVNLFKGPDAIEEIAEIIKAIERGKLKIRVRALEAERALERVAVMQDVMLKAMMARCHQRRRGAVRQRHDCSGQGRLRYLCRDGAAGVRGAGGKLNKLIKKGGELQRRVIPSRGREGE